MKEKQIWSIKKIFRLHRHLSVMTSYLIGVKQKRKKRQKQKEIKILFAAMKIVRHPFWMRDERLKEDISLINEVKITTEANNKARVCRLKFISISLYLVMNLYSSVRKRRRWAKRICRRQNRNGDVRTGITNKDIWSRNKETQACEWKYGNRNIETATYET